MRTIPDGAVRRIEAFLREMGKEGFEGVVLLAGPTTPGNVVLDTLILPGQRSARGLLGCSVEIPRDEVAALTSILRARGRALHMKIHTHPGGAYHSPLDLSNMLMQFDGALSIVVPDFCQRPIDLDECDIALYESSTWYWRGITDEWRKHVTIKTGEVTVLDRTQ